MSGVPFIKNCRYLAIRRYSSMNVVEKKPNVRWKEPAGFKTGIKVYNPILKDKTELITRKENVISWYSCGPTVYDSPHLGHACCYLHFDIIRRILENFRQIDVVQVMNITDIDDKIILRSNELGVNYRAVALKYEEEFFEQMSQLGVRRPSVVARVTEHMSDIVQFVGRITGRGFGYRTSDGTMNFTTEKYSNYGKLHQAQDEHNAEEAEKLSNKDFALWKGAKEGEPFWDSPWGPGRPGWHIECSAIASKYFGAPIDVHSGGIDLLFPHHENEEAQSCVYHETDQWVNYWLHSGHLNLQEQKMSKSLKNVISLDDFLRDYTPDHLRMLCLLVPYRNRIDYSSKVMTNAMAVLDKFNNFFSDCEAYVGDSTVASRIDENALLEELAATRARVDESFLDDFDTSSAISHLLKLIHVTNSMLHDKSAISHHQEHHASTVLLVWNYVKTCLEKLGCFTPTRAKDHLDARAGNLVQFIVDFRRQIRDLALNINKTDSTELQSRKVVILNLCDSLRNNLNTVGVELKDQGKKTTWSFKR